MKKAAILSFTDSGDATARKVADIIADAYETELVPRGVKKDVGTLFQACGVLIFVGACGIAVRMVAPHIVSKVSDPAVLVIDELGLQVISLLSGHIGGANELTRRVAAGLNAVPVITTATDINHRFSADEWARKNGLIILSMAAAKHFAAEILKRDLPVYTRFPIMGELTGGLYRAGSGDCGLAVTVRDEKVFDAPLTLVPRVLHLGIGCKRGTPAEKIETAVNSVFTREKLLFQAVADVSSIDVKSDEEGLLAFCRERGVPARFYDADTLNAVAGEFTASAFVRGTVGVDNVCERSAACSAGGNAAMLVRKTSLDGVTVAVACEDWRVCFE